MISVVRMATSRNEYHLVCFDPGGTIGWAHFIYDIRAFIKPETKVLRHLKSWECGEFAGSENQQVSECQRLIWRAKFGEMPFNTITNVVAPGWSKADIISEDFELTQMIGGKNLLSPVRINAKLDWICDRWAIKLELQRRSMRTSVTPARLEMFGFKAADAGYSSWSKSGRGKDAFAAMQHGVVWVRRVKQESLRRPWKLQQ